MAFDTHNWNFSPDDSEAMQGHQLGRLKVLAETLIRAFEAADLPKDHAGIDKAAKALLSLTKAVKAIYAPEKTSPKSSKSKDMRDDEMNDDTEATDLAEYRARAIAEDPRCAEWADWQFKLERKLIDLDRNRRDRSRPEEGYPGGASRTDGAAISGGLGEA